MPAQTITFAPAYLAEDRGFWKEQGVEVKLESIDGVLAMNALISGNVDFANIASITLLRARASGQKVVAIASLQDRIQFEIVVTKAFAERVHFDPSKPAEERVRALRGARLAVGAQKQFMHTYLTYVTKKAGLDPERDVTIAPIPPPAMVAALRQGQVDGFVVSRPWTSMARKGNGAVTVISSTGGDFPELTPFNTNLIAARTGFCESKQALCKKVIAGIDQSMALIRQKPDEAAQLLRKRFDKTDPDVVSESLNALLPGLPATTTVSDVGFKNAQEYMLSTGMMAPEEKLPSFADLYSNAFAANPQ